MNVQRSAPYSLLKPRSNPPLVNVEATKLYQEQRETVNVSRETTIGVRLNEIALENSVQNIRTSEEDSHPPVLAQRVRIHTSTHLPPEIDQALQNLRNIKYSVKAIEDYGHGIRNQIFDGNRIVKDLEAKEFRTREKVKQEEEKYKRIRSGRVVEERRIADEKKLMEMEKAALNSRKRKLDDLDIKLKQEKGIFEKTKISQQEQLQKTLGLIENYKNKKQKLNEREELLTTQERALQVNSEIQNQKEEQLNQKDSHLSCREQLLHEKAAQLAELEIKLNDSSKELDERYESLKSEALKQESERDALELAKKALVEDQVAQAAKSKEIANIQMEFARLMERIKTSTAL